MTSQREEILRWDRLTRVAFPRSISPKHLHCVLVVEMELTIASLPTSRVSAWASDARAKAEVSLNQGVGVIP